MSGQTKDDERDLCESRKRVTETIDVGVNCVDSNYKELEIKGLQVLLKDNMKIYEIILDLETILSLWNISNIVFVFLSNR